MKSVLSPSAARRCQQILHQLERRDDVSLLRAVLFRQDKFRKQHDDGGQHTLCTLVEECIVAILRGALRIDDRFSKDLGVFFCFRLGSEIVGVSFCSVHIVVHERHKIETVRARRIAQVNDRDLIAVIFRCDAAVVTCEVALGVERQIAHAAGAGVFEIRV